MSKSNAFENKFLQLVFHNANIANIGDATGLRGSTAAGNLYVALHTADPGEAGVGNTSEATYTGYARKAVSRIAGNWTINNNQVQNAVAVAFDPCSAGSNTITHFSIQSEASGATDILYKGALTASLVVSAGITPNFAINQITITED